MTKRAFPRSAYRTMFARSTSSSPSTSASSGSSPSPAGRWAPGRPISGPSATRRWCPGSCPSAGRRARARTTSCSSRASRARSPPTRPGITAGTTPSPPAASGRWRASTRAGGSRRRSTSRSAMRSSGSRHSRTSSSASGRASSSTTATPTTCSRCCGRGSTVTSARPRVSTARSRRRSAPSRRGRSSCRPRRISTSRPRTTSTRSGTCRTPSCGSSRECGATSPGAAPTRWTSTSSIRGSATCSRAERTGMPKNLFPLDNTKKFTDQKHVGHNRWHPDIPPVVSVKPGDVFRADCREWFDGAIHNDDSAEDVRNAPLPGVHVLSGPFRVEGAQPGDLLIVDILEIDACDQEDEGPFSGMGWGYTGVFAKSNGGGFLVDRFPDAYKVIWDFRGDVATSRHIPECSYVGIHHPGLMGTAPSAELLAKWTKRETDLIATDPGRVPPLALPPLPDSAILGSLSGAEFDRVAGEAARTAPPRENGGNQDIKNFTAGTRVFYPVFVEGANLSFGDLHFSQGDGEITFCGAIEMGGFMDLHVDVIKGGMETFGVAENAIFMPGLRDPQYSEWIAFSGVSVDLDGKQHYLDSQLSYERACHHAIDYLMKFGYSDIQAYMILGSAPVEGRFSGVVDIPNSCATVYIPRRIFDFDVAPSSGKPHQVEQGVQVPKSAN